MSINTVYFLRIGDKKARTLLIVINDGSIPDQGSIGVVLCDDRGIVFLDAG